MWADEPLDMIPKIRMLMDEETGHCQWVQPMDWEEYFFLMENPNYYVDQKELELDELVREI